jgi:hypothetical protein
MPGVRGRVRGTEVKKALKIFWSQFGHKIFAMEEPAPVPTTARFYFRFVDRVGFGSCDGCYQIGPVDHLCLHCCVSEGMTLGSCFVCMNDGPAWEQCHWCKQGRYLPPGYGQCCECEWHGIVGEACQNCEDGLFTQLAVNSRSDSSNVVLDIIVAAELEADEDTTTDSSDPDQPVALWTWSSQASP